MESIRSAPFRFGNEDGFSNGDVASSAFLRDEGRRHRAHPWSVGLEMDSGSQRVWETSRVEKQRILRELGSYEPLFLRSTKRFQTFPSNPSSSWTTFSCTRQRSDSSSNAHSFRNRISFCTRGMFPSFFSSNVQVFNHDAAILSSKKEEKGSCSAVHTCFFQGRTTRRFTSGPSSGGLSFEAVVMDLSSA